MMMRVGGVAVHIRQRTGAGGDGAVDGDFVETAIKQRLTPLVGGHSTVQTIFLQQHPDFPDGDGGKSNRAVQEGLSDAAARLGADTALSGDKPDAGMGVQYRHRLASSSISFQVLNHSDGIGDTMSPRISTLTGGYSGSCGRL